MPGRNLDSPLGPEATGDCRSANRALCSMRVPRASRLAGHRARVGAGSAVAQASKGWVPALPGHKFCERVGDSFQMGWAPALPWRKMAPHSRVRRHAAWVSSQEARCFAMRFFRLFVAVIALLGGSTRFVDTASICSEMRVILSARLSVLNLVVGN